MNPPINRENLRDVLIAFVVATGLAWVVGSFKEGVRAKFPQAAIHYRMPSRVP